MNNLKNIEEHIKILMKKTNIPGISLAIINKNKKDMFYHGFSDNKKNP